MRPRKICGLIRFLPVYFPYWMRFYSSSTLQTCYINPTLKFCAPATTTTFSFVQVSWCNSTYFFLLLLQAKLTSLYISPLNNKKRSRKTICNTCFLNKDRKNLRFVVGPTTSFLLRFCWSEPSVWCLVKCVQLSGVVGVRRTQCDGAATIQTNFKWVFVIIVLCVLWMRMWIFGKKRWLVVLIFLLLLE